MSHKWVYLFTEVDEAEQYVGGSWDGVRALLGGKGAGLADMIRGKLPVPPGFTVTTEACNAYLAAGEQFPEGLWEQELAAMKATEAATGKVFGDPSNPLLVSCRSGAKFSMPGMMDTVLNIGLNDDTVAGMVTADRQREVRLQLVPPPGADVRLGGDGRRQGSLREGAGGLPPQGRRGQRL